MLPSDRSIAISFSRNAQFRISMFSSSSEQELRIMICRIKPWMCAYFMSRNGLTESPCRCLHTCYKSFKAVVISTRILLWISYFQRLDLFILFNYLRVGHVEPAMAAENAGPSNFVWWHTFKQENIQVLWGAAARSYMGLLVEGEFCVVVHRVWKCRGPL